MKPKSTQLLVADELTLRKVALPKVTLRKLMSFDEQIRQAYGFNVLIGVDEVGRGCLAGPVYAAALVMPKGPLGKTLSKQLKILNDSKQLSIDERERLTPILEHEAIWAVASASPQEIDQINILQASLLAMRRAIESMIAKYNILNLAPLVVVDGRTKIPELTYKQLPVIKGDGQSACIAAASIIAKVHRDRFMTKLAEELPNYHWHSNKGYSCRSHVEAILTHGTTVWHRRSFLRKYSVQSVSLDPTMALDFSQASYEEDLVTIDEN
jgi:ribonuclease HII